MFVDLTFHVQSFPCRDLPMMTKILCFSFRSVFVVIKSFPESLFSIFISHPPSTRQLFAATKHNNVESLRNVDEVRRVEHEELWKSQVSVHEIEIEFLMNFNYVYEVISWCSSGYEYEWVHRCLHFTSAKNHDKINEATYINSPLSLVHLGWFWISVN